MKDSKKLIFRLAALCLLLAFAFGAFAGCTLPGELIGKLADDLKATEAPEPGEQTPAQADEELILGRWSADADFSRIFSAMMDRSESFAGLQFANVKMKFVMTFNEDNTYTAELEAGSVQVAIDLMLYQMQPRIQTIFREKAAEALGLDADAITDEQVFSILSPLGFTSWDDVTAFCRDSMDLSAITDSVHGAGSYRLEDGKIFLENFFAAGTEESGRWFPYELTAESLVLSYGDNVIGENLDTLFPLAFSR